MAHYRLLKHKDYDRSAADLPTAIQRKALWAQVLLGTRGRTPSVKGTTGLNARWRRTPVQGNHYYMWWIPGSESGLDAVEADAPTSEQTILVHSIRHHDDTDNPIFPGALADYEEVPVTALDPRHEEQTQVSQRVQGEQVALATIKGLPGSGKTVSLLYLVRDLALREDLNQILYVTYTKRLKRAAQEFLVAQGEGIAQKIRVATLGEIESQLTKLPGQQEPFGELASFMRFLDYQTAASVGPWRRYPQTLFTEIRAHLLGKTFPPGYTLPTTRLNEVALFSNGLDATAYAASRKLDLAAAEAACRLAERAQEQLLFQDQKAAYQAIQRLSKGKSPGWVADLDALVIDEVQDLTLVQIAILGELVRERIRRRADAPLVFVVAGDESQIVQPSGFDWGLTKDLLGEQVGTWPEEFEFHYQRRSPRNLAQLIDSTWNFYRSLPRPLRPSARRQAFAYETVGENATDEGNGQVFLCPVAFDPADQRAKAAEAWQQLIEEMTAKPGRVIIDLTETLRDQLTTQLESTLPLDTSDEVVFLPREIKGLERTTVLVYGLNALYLRTQQLCDEGVQDNIPYFEARRLFDEIRVALSRSTDRLVLLEAQDAPVMTALAIQEIPGILPIRWADLLETLATEELSAIEVIEGYLDEVDDLFERAMWTQGYRRNRRAYGLALQLEDHALQREAQEQYIMGYLQEATALLEAQAWQAAHERQRRAAELAQDFGDPLLLDEVDDQRAILDGVIAKEIAARLQMVEERVKAQQFSNAYQLLQTAGQLATLAADSKLADQVDETFTVVAWLWGAQLLDQGQSVELINRIVALFTETATILQRQTDQLGVQIMQLLAARYRELPPAEHFSTPQLVELLNRAQAYLTLVKPLKLEDDAYLYLCRWLDEAFAYLARQPRLYFRWAMLGQELAGLCNYAPFDEHLWELEHWLNLQLGQQPTLREETEVKRFQAFLAAYNEQPAQASVLWEQLGEIELAIQCARAAGDLERAYSLLRQARLPMPEELAVTVKALRLLQQLEQKYQGLLPAERQTLLRELQVMCKKLMAAEDDGDFWDSIEAAEAS
ncbi:MAG: AAA family ATPase [Caldilineaceae bacterium]